tara:strand:- start:49085 stop:49540 length:456 start_codon:yes stop_codon:yes gene_type:complete
MKLTMAIIAAFSCGILYWFLKQEYRPARVIKQADQFITFLQNGDTQSAFEMTLKTKAVGTNLAAFSERAAIQFPMRHDQIESKQINYVRSGQTYGNRLRRWLASRKIDEDKISIDYTIRGKPGQGLILFEVRFFRVGENVWKISYFQSHAG